MGERDVTNTNQKEYTAIIQQHDKWWIGWIKEVPGVVCQEHTYEELIESLHLGLEDILDCDSEKPRRNISDNDYQEVPIYL